jgi:hypothetical protein
VMGVRQLASEDIQLVLQQERQPALGAAMPAAPVA